MSFLNRKSLSVLSLGLSLLVWGASHSAYAEKGGELADKYRCDSGYKLGRNKNASGLKSSEGYYCKKEAAASCPSGYKLDSDSGRDDCYHPTTGDVKIAQCLKEGRDYDVVFDKNGGKGSKDSCIHFARPHQLQCPSGAFLLSGDAVKNTEESKFDDKLSKSEKRGWSCVLASVPSEN